MRYLLIALLAFLFDRITKYLAFNFLAFKEYMLFPFLYFKLVINRGISWGIFNSLDTYVFSAVTLIVILVSAYLFYYTISRLNRGYLIIGETLVLTGSISNIIDRFIYGGVIDFIVFDFGFWIFPVFNIADAVIFIGISVMFLQLTCNKNELISNC